MVPTSLEQSRAALPQHPEDREQGPVILARCDVPGCGAQSLIDPAPWLAQGLRGARLHHLEERLRCTCGARRVSLALLCEGDPPPQGRGRIYIFS